MNAFLPLARGGKAGGAPDPAGPCAPSSLSKARGGEPAWRTPSPNAETVGPPWKKVQTIAIINNRPFAISAASFPCVSAGTLGVRTLGTKGAASSAMEGSPGFVAA